MLLHTGALVRIYFGNAHDELFPVDYLTENKSTNKSFDRAIEAMRLQSLLFLRQTHSADGLIVSPELVAKAESFSQEGDYLITDLSGVGLGVMTADCLPVIIFDTVRNVVGIAHAGWRGSVQSIAVEMLNTMQNNFQTNPGLVRVFFGPSAKSCCYAVDTKFLMNFESFPYAEKAIHKHSDEQLFFDVPGFNRLQLERAGVKKEAFRLDYNICTICDPAFYSYRRQGNQAGRQMTIVSLK